MTKPLVLCLVLALPLLFAACSDTGVLEQRVAALEAEVATLETVPGPAGERGEQGPQGQPGKDAELPTTPIVIATDVTASVVGTTTEMLYCIEYSLLATMAERCQYTYPDPDSGFSDARRAFDASQLRCFDTAKIGEPLPECWR